MAFNNEENLIFFLNPIFIRVNLPTHISPRKNLQLFLILASWSYPKCKDILQTLNVYEIPAKNIRSFIAEREMKYQFRKYGFENI